MTKKNGRIKLGGEGFTKSYAESLYYLIYGFTYSQPKVKFKLFLFRHKINKRFAQTFVFCRYVPEGNMSVCGTDYLTKGWESRSYVLVYGIWVYFLPLVTIIYSYTFIMKVIGRNFNR
jgi:hypothetical protein